MKKICFITTVPITIKAFILKTANYIHENTDWDISVICSNDEDFGKTLPEYIHYYPVHMERGISLSGVKAMLQMKKIFHEQQFDLIQYSTPNAAMYASMAGQMAGVPVRLYCQWGMAYKGMNGLKRKIFKIMEKTICRFSTEIEPDSRSNLKFAHEQKLYPSNIGNVIWNGSACGVDLVKFDINKKEQYREDIRNRYSITDNDFLFGFVGRITRDKGINELLSSFKVISEKNNNAYLMIVGSNEVGDAVDKELYNWSINDSKVIYTGFTDVVEQYLSAMDCYILPSYHEGFGMSIIEAEAMGLPVIVTNIPGPIDAMINDETGIIVKKADKDTLIGAMEELLNDNDKLLSYGNAALNYARNNFDQKVMLEQILADRKRLLKEDN